MANYRKSFNFKNGVQVDNDNFIVDPVGKVGIGTTIARQFLDIYGNDSGAVQVRGQVKVSGLTTTTSLYAGNANVGIITGEHQRFTGITTLNGLKVGDSPVVNNLIGYAYTAWITDNGGVGLRTDSYVGIGTVALSDFSLLIGSDPRESGTQGIGFTDGNISATGTITAPTFSGNLTGIADTANVLGTAHTIAISGDLLGSTTFDGSASVTITGTLSTTFNANTSGIITASTLSGAGLTITGNSSIGSTTGTVTTIGGSLTVVGGASIGSTTTDSTSVTGSLSATSVTAGTLTANNSATLEEATVNNILTTKHLTQSTGGIATFLNIDGSYGNFDNLDVGVNTSTTLKVQDTTESTSLVSIANTVSSRIGFGLSDPGGNQSATITYSSADGSLELKNYDYGNINVELHAGSGDVPGGSSEGIFAIKSEDTTVFTATQDGRVSIGKTLEDGLALDVEGTGKFSQGLNIVGVITLTNTSSDTLTIDPDEPYFPVDPDTNFNVSSGISTFNDLQVIGTITPRDGESGVLSLGLSKFDNTVVGIGTTVMVVGYDDGDTSTEFYTITLNRSNVLVDGDISAENLTISQGFSLISGQDNNGGAKYPSSVGYGTEFAGHIDNLTYRKSSRLHDVAVGSTFTLGSNSTTSDLDDESAYLYYKPSRGATFTVNQLLIFNADIEQNSNTIEYDVPTPGQIPSGIGTGHYVYAPNSRNLFGFNREVAQIADSAWVNGTKTRIRYVLDRDSRETLVNETFHLGTTLTEELPSQEQTLKIHADSRVTIGSTVASIYPYNDAGYRVVFRSNSIFTKDSTVALTGVLMTRPAQYDSYDPDSGTFDGSSLYYSSGGILDSDGGGKASDPRGSADSRPSTAPHFTYGENFDIETNSATMIFDGSLAIVPVPGKSSTTNLGSPESWSGGILPDYAGRQDDPNTGDSNNSRLTMVGINTYIPRCLLDLGASSPSMNSYMILPTLDQTSINIVQGLWDDANSVNQGHDNAQRLTPNGVPQGAILYNSTTDQVQVRNTANSFRNLNPIVAFGRVESETLQTGSFNVSYSSYISSSSPTTGLPVTRINFSTALPNANYTVIYSHENGNGNNSNLVNTITDQQTTHFEITWGNISNLNWYFSVLQV
jgi:hypothetical protein